MFSSKRKKSIDFLFFFKKKTAYEIDREIEKVGDERNGFAVLGQAPGLQDVQSFDNQNVRSIDLDPYIGDNVVDEMRIDRRMHRPPPGFDVREKPQQSGKVVAFRKSLLVHQPFALEHSVWEKKSVGGEKIDLGHIGPACQQGLQDAGCRGLADRDRAADADDIRHLGVLGAEERLLCPKQPLHCRDVKREQARQRQVDFLYFRHVEAIVH